MDKGPNLQLIAFQPSNVDLVSQLSLKYDNYDILKVYHHVWRNITFFKDLKGHLGYAQ